MRTKQTSDVKQQGFLLAACLLMTLCLGSVHGFSIFLEQIESQLEVSRFASSLVYSLALASITLAVFVGHWIFRAFSAPLVVAVAIGLTVLGFFVATQVTGYSAFLVGYGFIFGFANGMGYALAIHLCGTRFKENKGLAIGIVTAVYPVGAMITSFAAAPWLEHVSVKVILGYQGMLIVGCLVLAMIVLFFLSKGETQEKHHSSATPIFNRVEKNLVVRLFLAYGFGVFAGLMVIGHASGMMRDSGGSLQFAAFAIVAVSAGNILGGLIGGGLADKFSPRSAFLMVLGLSLLALTVLLIGRSPAAVFVGMAFLGLAYGAYIVVVPTAVSNYFGPEASAKAYGLVFLAWGSAGILAPGFAGWLYEVAGYFPETIILAIVFTLAAVILARGLPSSAED